MTRARGYILVETLTAMAVLSITAVTVQQAEYTAVQARGLSQDYTTAQFLMEGIVGMVDLEPRVAVGDIHSGVFPVPNDRFEYTWSVEKADVPLPPAAPTVTPAERAALAGNYLDYMGRLRVEIRWSRGGQPFAVAGETLLSPERVWFENPEAVP